MRKKMGGFFIGTIFLFVSCVDSVINDGVIPEVELRNYNANDTSFVEPKNGNEELESDNLNVDVDVEKDDPWDYQRVQYQIKDAGFSFSNLNYWNISEISNLESEYIFMMGNFVFDGLDHPKDGEIVVEGLSFLNDERLDLWHYAILKRSGLRCRIVDYEMNDESLRLLFDCLEIPEGFEGGWMTGFVEDYYFVKGNKVYFFSASVLKNDESFLRDFDDMMESVEIDSSPSSDSDGRREAGNER
ncbi:MAG: hypothetical protein WC663_03760 [Patescibacteria group bacterium]|jgi:hypothetical protein